MTRQAQGAARGMRGIKRVAALVGGEGLHGTIPFSWVLGTPPGVMRITESPAWSPANRRMGRMTQGRCCLATPRAADQAACDQLGRHYFADRFLQKFPVRPANHWLAWPAECRLTGYRVGGVKEPPHRLPERGLQFQKFNLTSCGPGFTILDSVFTRVKTVGSCPYGVK